MNGARAAVVVVGAGNIGSHVVPLLARLVDIGTLTIIDKDVYEAKNLDGQAIRPRDVGAAKARVQARRARRLRADLVVRAYSDALENLPLGFFGADLLLGCLDSREARRRLSELAFRVGVPYLDAGVNAGGLLARVTAYDSRDAEAACLQCAWGAADYAALEQVYPCRDGAVAAAPPTNASAALGALAAALQALECEKWLRERPDRLPAGSEVLIDAASHTQHRTTNRRNPSCRFPHERWTIERLAEGPSALSLGAALALAGAASPADGVLSVAGQRFVMRMVCASCGTERPLARLVVALRLRDRACATCGQENVPRGFDLDERLDPATLPTGALRRSLRSFGLRHGDVFTITHAGGPRHFELGPPPHQG